MSENETIAFDFLDLFSFKTESALTMEHLTYFRTALRHFVNFQQKQKFERLVKIRSDQQNLPIFQFKRHIIESVRRQQVILVAGDTGCGKSTQVYYLYQ